MTGYEASIKETARLTDEQIELTESAIAVLDMKLSILTDSLADQPEISVTYFQPDEKKDGGAYVTVTGALKKIDDYERTIVLVSGERIAIQDIGDIESELFKELP